MDVDESSESGEYRNENHNDLHNHTGRWKRCIALCK